MFSARRFAVPSQRRILPSPNSTAVRIRSSNPPPTPITTTSPLLFVLFCERAQDVFLRANLDDRQQTMVKDFYDSLISSSFPNFVQSHVVEQQTTSTTPKIIQETATAARNLLEQVSLQLLKETTKTNQTHDKMIIAFLLPKLMKWAKHVGDYVSSSQISPCDIVPASFVSLMQFELTRRIREEQLRQEGDQEEGVGNSHRNSVQVASGRTVGGVLSHQLSSLVYSWMNLLHVEQLGHLWTACDVALTSSDGKSGVSVSIEHSVRREVLDSVALESAQRVKKSFSNNQACSSSRTFSVLAASLIAPSIRHLASWTASGCKNKNNNNNGDPSGHDDDKMRNIRFHINKFLSCMKQASCEKDVWPVLFDPECKQYFLANPEAAAFVLQSLGPSSEIWKESLSQEFVNEVYQLVLTCVEAIRPPSSSQSNEINILTSVSSSSSSSLVAGEGAEQQKHLHPDEEHNNNNSNIDNTNVRLYIGIRNGAKILHVAKDFVDLAELYDKSSSSSSSSAFFSKSSSRSDNSSNNKSKNGDDAIKKFFTSWHISDALLQVGRPFDAARSIDDFFHSTRHLFLERLPKAIQLVVFSIATALGKVGAVDHAVLLLEASCRWDLPTLRPANVLRSILQGAEVDLQQRQQLQQQLHQSSERKSITVASCCFFDIRKLMKWSARTPGVMAVPAAQIAAMKLAIHEDYCFAIRRQEKHDGGDEHHLRNNKNNNQHQPDEMNDIFGNNFSSGEETIHSKKSSTNNNNNNSTRRKTALQDVLESVCAKSVSYHISDIQDELFVRAIRALLSCNMHFVAAAQVLMACTEQERNLIPLSLLHSLKNGLTTMTMNSLSSAISSSSTSSPSSFSFSSTTMMMMDEVSTVTLLQSEVSRWIQEARNRKALEREQMKQLQEEEAEIQEEQHDRGEGSISNEEAIQKKRRLDHFWTCSSCSTPNKNSVECCWRCSSLRDPAWHCESCSAFNIIPRSTLQAAEKLLQRREIQQKQQGEERGGQDERRQVEDIFIAKIPCIECEVCSLSRPVLELAAADDDRHQEKENDAKWKLMKNLQPVSPWSCPSCSNSNSTSNPHFCTKCGSGNPNFPKVQSFSCKKCSFVNDRGMLRPWCAQCGTLHENVTKNSNNNDEDDNNYNANASKSKAHLWSCNACGMLVPWIVDRCTGCRSPRSVVAPLSQQNEESSDVRHRHESAAVAWRTWDCVSCSTTNPPWVSTCRKCRKSSSNVVVVDDESSTQQNQAREPSTNSDAIHIRSGAKCNTCGFVELADLRRTGHWCSQCGSALYRNAGSSSNSSSSRSLYSSQKYSKSTSTSECDDDDDSSSQDKNNNFWFVSMIESSLNNEPIPKRRPSSTVHDSLSGYADELQASEESATSSSLSTTNNANNRFATSSTSSAPLPLEHPETKETLMWICPNPSLCLTANLISDRKCRGCGRFRDSSSSSMDLSSQHHNKNQVLNVSRYKLADDYLFAPRHNPHYLQLIASKKQQQQQQQNSLLMMHRHERQHVQENEKSEDDDDNDECISSSSSSHIVNQTIEEEQNLAKEMVEKLDAASNSIPALLARSYSQVCPNCNNKNSSNENMNGDDYKNRKQTTYWCDARSLCGFCHNCCTFSCPLPEPIVLFKNSPSHRYYQKMMTSSLSSSSSSTTTTTTTTTEYEHRQQQIEGDDDRSLRLWAALRLTHSMMMMMMMTTTTTEITTSSSSSSIEEDKHQQHQPYSVERKINLVESLVKLLASQIPPPATTQKTHENQDQHRQHHNRLPWQGYDILSRAFPDSPREPVVLCVDPLTRADVVEKPHHALKGLVDEILRKMVEIISCSTSWLQVKDDNNLFRTRALKACLNLVSVVNASSDFDELGFETLLQVSYLFREKRTTQQTSDSMIERRLKILYLSQMKLQPRDIVGESFCWKCLNPTCVCPEEKSNWKTKNQNEGREMTEIEKVQRHHASSPLASFGSITKTSRTQEKEQGTKMKV